MVAEKGGGPATVVCYLLNCLLSLLCLLCAEDREVELDDDNLQRILSKEDKDEEQEDIKDEMLELGEINEGEFVDSFIGTQQHMNAFDLLLPTMEHQLRSGI